MTVPVAGQEADHMPALREFDIEFEGTTIHCWEGGTGRPLALMHGSGAGCGTFSNFGAVIEGLCQRFHILATDMVGYGKSGRRPAQPYFDVDMWVRQLQALIDHLGEPRVGLAGHSLAGALALKLAARDDRVAAVLTTGTMGTPLPPRPEGWTWSFPPDRAAIRAHILGTLYDKSLVPEGEVEERAKVLYAPGYREYFTSMFGADGRVFFDKSTLTKDELDSIACPVLLMHGRNDTFLSPEESSLPLSACIPQSDAMILGRCGHSVSLEYPGKFTSAAEQLFGGAMGS
jgi:2-hydroxymuconate-semialdehyde hydrolase